MLPGRAASLAAGRYRDIGDVVVAGVSLLQRSEAEVAAFVASLGEAQAASERDGFFGMGDVHREMSEMLDELVRASEPTGDPGAASRGGIA